MKNIAIIAVGQKTAYSCREQLHAVLGSRVNVIDYYIKGNLPKEINVDFVVYASQLAYTTSKSHVLMDTPYLIARRSINYNEIGELFDLKTGTDVLLVNDCMSSANETISLLQTLGIDHLNYYAYTPGMKLNRLVKVAITPGEKILVPSYIEEIIDIKTRLIDITSLVELLSQLNMLDYYADFLSANYVRDIVQFIARSHHYQEKTSQFKKELYHLKEFVQEKRKNEHTKATYCFSEILGESTLIKRSIDIAKKFSNSESTVLIQAESGTGKEMFAQSIHNASNRANGPFVAVNFAAITESLLDSELFGYVEGAFTGASRRGSVGLFERANKGTIFLDEIGDAPLSFQIKLLRVLQEREIRRVGSTTSINIDIRIVAATNQNLKNLIACGKFRQDLYYRLNILPISIPSLRERPKDVKLLAIHFLKQYYNEMNNKELHMWFSNIGSTLEKYLWPGNIRELQNVVEYLINICGKTVPLISDLPDDFIMKKKENTLCLNENIEECILSEIRLANENMVPVGRRSLAYRLDLPESRIRDILKKLVEDEKIILNRGRKGIKLL